MTLIKNNYSFQVVIISYKYNDKELNSQVI